MGLPGRVVGPSEKSDQIVRVEVGGETHEINIAILEEDVDVGDWLEIHMGHAMAKLSEEEAQEMISFMEELDAAHRRTLEDAFGVEASGRGDREPHQDQDRGQDEGEADHGRG